MENSIPDFRKREWVAGILENGREREFPLTPGSFAGWQFAKAKRAQFLELHWEENQKFESAQEAALIQRVKCFLPFLLYPSTPQVAQKHTHRRKCRWLDSLYDTSCIRGSCQNNMFCKLKSLEWRLFENTWPATRSVWPFVSALRPVWTIIKLSDQEHSSANFYETRKEFVFLFTFCWIWFKEMLYIWIWLPNLRNVLKESPFQEDFSSKQSFKFNDDKRLTCLQTDGICSNKANCFTLPRMLNSWFSANGNKSFMIWIL